jgi:hypothetical protein
LDFILPESFRVTIVGEPFLIYDNKDAYNRMMIFLKTWFADGTFKTGPQIFQQLFTIHFLRNSKAYPTVFALLQKLKTIEDNLISKKPTSMDSTHFFLVKSQP